ncbi:hypothetical protein B5S32_g1141 [[Candida] boidinii]|nr:hypothetical protein B5S29_g998 [[Candida] boidinii]OWB76984.1 hypothetical protein B5S32_g1141 [[Candida] boidinii]
MSTLEEQANLRKERLEKLRKLRNQRKQELSNQQQIQQTLIPINNDLNSLVYNNTSDLDTFYYKDNNNDNPISEYINNNDLITGESIPQEQKQEQEDDDNNSVKKIKLNTESSPTIIDTDSFSQNENSENNGKNDSMTINDLDTLETKTNELTNNLLNDYEKTIDSFKIDFKYGNSNTSNGGSTSHTNSNSNSNSLISNSTTNTSIDINDNNNDDNDEIIKISTHHDYSDDIEYSNLFTTDEIIPEYDRILAKRVNKLHKKTDQSIMSSLRKKFKKITV